MGRRVVAGLGDGRDVVGRVAGVDVARADGPVEGHRRDDGEAQGCERGLEVALREERDVADPVGARGVAAPPRRHGVLQRDLDEEVAPDLEAPAPRGDRGPRVREVLEHHRREDEVHASRREVGRRRRLERALARVDAPRRHEVDGLAVELEARHRRGERRAARHRLGRQRAPAAADLDDGLEGRARGQVPRDEGALGLGAARDEPRRGRSAGSRGV